MNLYFYFVINVMYKNLERNKSRCNNYGAIILYCQINVFFPFSCIRLKSNIPQLPLCQQCNAVRKWHKLLASQKTTQSSARLCQTVFHAYRKAIDRNETYLSKRLIDSFLLLFLAHYPEICWQKSKFLITYPPRFSHTLFDHSFFVIVIFKNYKIKRSTPDGVDNFLSLFFLNIYHEITNGIKSC